MIETHPLFPSVERAVFWAYYLARHEPGIVGGPSFARFIKSDEHERDEDQPMSRPAHIQMDGRPKGLDAAAQAGMIKSAIEKMPADQRCHLMASILRSLERTKAQNELVVFVCLALPDVTAALIYDCIVKHYGKRGISIAALAKKHDIDRRKLTAIRRQVEITLDAISYRAETAAYLKLQRMGVVA